MTTTPEGNRPQYHDGTVIPETEDASTREATRGEDPTTGALLSEGAEHAATVAEISPPTGPAAGGTVVSLIGDNFGGTTSVTFGGVAGTALTVVDERHLHVTTPANADNGPVDIVVHNPAGNATAADGFAYEGGALAFTDIAPDTGDAAGGDAVVITGANFGGSTSVTFGGVAGTAFAVIDEDTIHVTTPAHAAAAVDVVVHNPAGGNLTAAGAFTYA